SKYSMPFLVAGLGVGVLGGDLRVHLRSKWLWLGAAISIVIFLPNLLWQWQHDFISLQFLQHIHARDVRIGRTKDFLPDQLELMSFALPVAASGLFFYFSRYGGRRFRVLGWMFVVPFALFLLAQGRGYYMAAGYPIVYAVGPVILAVWGIRLSPFRRPLVVVLGWPAPLINIGFFGA